MNIPPFIKEVIWSVYPPRYKQLSEQTFRSSLGYMSKLLFLSIIIAGIILLPTLALVKGTIGQELNKFDTFTINEEITQTGIIQIPRTNPWVHVDLNKEHLLENEFLVIDSEKIRYRLFGINVVDQESLKNLNSGDAQVNKLFATIMFLLLPGIGLLIFIKAWIKYFLLALLIGTVLFIILELTKFRLRWKEALNIAIHSLTIIIPVEIISASVYSKYLIPTFKFIGLNVYALSTVVFVILAFIGAIGYQVEQRKKRRRTTS